MGCPVGNMWALRNPTVVGYRIRKAAMGLAHHLPAYMHVNARSLSLSNLCACCVSDTRTRNFHASGTDTEQLSHSFIILNVISYLEKLVGEITSEVTCHHFLSFNLVNNLILPLSKYFYLQLICIKCNVPRKKNILHSFSLSVPDMCTLCVYTSLTQHVHKLGRLNVSATGALVSFVPRFQQSVLSRLLNKWRPKKFGLHF